MMKNKKLAWGIFFGLLLLAGIFLISTLFPKQVPPPGPGPTPPPISKKIIPNLLVAHESGLTKLVYDNTTNIYRNQLSYELLSPIAITSLENSFFVATKDSIFRLNAYLEKEKELKIGEIGALASSDKNIFLSANGSFVVLNKDLEKLSSVQLIADFFDRTKNAHDILIYKNTAYLLDNIVHPVYLFRVNIEDPKNIKISDRIEVMGINQHLHDQWLNPQLDQWIVIQSGGHRRGSYQNILIYPMKDGVIERASQEIYHHWIREGKPEGVLIKAVTQFSPAWVVVEKDDKYYLAEINTENDNVSFSNFLELGLKEDRKKVIIKQFGDYLFVTIGNFLRIIDITQEPKIILSQEMEKSILDFLFIF